MDISKDHGMFSEYSLNEKGEDYIVGDIHGHFRKLDDALEDINFDYANDRLFVVGDLIDRGPFSHEALSYLEKPWFHSVVGNHEEMLIRGYLFESKKDASHENSMMYRTWMGNGGRWAEDILSVNMSFIEDMAVAFSNLPYFIEVPVKNADGDVKKVGIVHAELNLTNDWDILREIATDFENGKADTDNEFAKVVRNLMSDATWSRDRITHLQNMREYSPKYQPDPSPVLNVDGIFSGHTPIIYMTKTAPLTIDNVHYLDTAVYYSDEGFQIIKLNDFEF